MSEIFKTEHFETANNSLLSFKDCPNHCVDGYYVNPYTHKKLLCEYCRDKRKSMVVTQNREEVSGDTISALLRIPQSLQGYTCDINTVFPELKNDVRNEEDLEEVKTEMNTLMNGIAVGTLPEYSILFDLGVKTFENNFIYPYLMRAYMEGLSVAPFLTSYDVCRLRYAQEYGEELDEYNLTFND